MPDRMRRPRMALLVTAALAAAVTAGITAAALPVLPAGNGGSASLAEQDGYQLPTLGFEEASPAE